MSSLKSKDERIGFLTTSRADLGIQSLIIRKLANKKASQRVYLLVGASQLPIPDDSFRNDISENLEIVRLLGTEVVDDTWTAATRLIGAMGSAVSRAIEDLGLEKLVILGDRYEILGAAYAGALSSAEVIHIHGGEVTEGAIDEYVRHAVSKLSNKHLVTTDVHRNRLLAMGEQPHNVFVVGPLGAESLSQQSTLSREELETGLGVRLAEHNLVLTFHPETMAGDFGQNALRNVLRSITALGDYRLVITETNSDPGSELIKDILKNHLDNFPDSTVFRPNLGPLLYSNVMRHFDVMIGNSSSGLLEAPYFGIQVINVGKRQQGRDSFGKILNCEGDHFSVSSALHTALSIANSSVGFRNLNPLDDSPSDRTLEIIQREAKSDKAKQFYDLSYSQ